MVCPCNDCERLLHVRSFSFLGHHVHNYEWFFVKDRVWQQACRKSEARFLCVGCLEKRIGRKLVAADFKRSPKINFEPQSSVRLRRRMRGLKPARRMIETVFDARMS